MSRGATGRDGEPYPIRWVCPAYIVVGHERHGCTRELGYGQRYHNLRHETIVGEPCPSCGGFDEHTDACPTPEHMAARDIWLWWLNDGSYELEGSPDV